MQQRVTEALLASGPIERYAFARLSLRASPFAVTASWRNFVSFARMPRRISAAPRSASLRPIERRALARSFLERRRKGVDRLLQSRPVAAALTQLEQCASEVVLGFAQACGFCARAVVQRGFENRNASSNRVLGFARRGA